jgi:putative tricarboxylic transport membrane protein
MSNQFNRILFNSAISVLIVAAPATAPAQGWSPQRNVEIVVPVPAGGAVDLLARSMQQAWVEQKLVPVSSSISNRGGGGHAIAYNYLHQHPGNPHIVGIMSSNLLSSHIANRMPVTYTDFTPIALLVTGSYYALTVPADSPFKSARDFIETLKKNPAALAVGLGSAAGASHHTALGLALLSAGIDVAKVKTVSFNESSALITALLGGHVAAGMATAINTTQHVENGKLRVLAISAPRRVSGVLANVPTWTELGYKGTWESWRGLIGTKSLTAAQTAYWEDVAKRVTENPQFRKFVESGDLEPKFMGSVEVRKWLAAQYDDMKSIMLSLGYTKE